MQCYYRDPQRSAEAMTADGWLRTGDLGDIDELGRLRITGRAKEQFKTSKGKYVAPAPIENMLGANSRNEAVCVAGPDYAQPFALLMLSAVLSAATTRDRVFRAAIHAELSALRDAHNAHVHPLASLDFLASVREQWTGDNGFL